MAKTSFEEDLDSRISKARERVKQKTTTLDAPPPDLSKGDIVVENASVVPLETAEVPAEIAAPPEIAPAAEPPPEPAPVEMPPPIQAKPEPEPAPVEAKAPEEPKPDVERYRAEREARRKVRQLEKEIAALRAKQEAVPPPQVAPESSPVISDDDPFGIKAANERTLAEVNRKLEEQRRELEAERARLEIQRQTAAFAVQHPDYEQAVNHLRSWERDRVIKSGIAVAQGRQLRAAAEAQEASNPQVRAYIERVENYADEKGLSDEEAWTHAAADTWVQARENEILESARLTGQSPAQAAWNMATSFAGYQPQQGGTEAPRAAAAPEVVDSGPPISPAERIRQQARASAAGKSLSAASASTPSPTQPTIQTLQQWNAWRQKDPVAARQWMEQQSRTNPNWHRNLAG